MKKFNIQAINNIKETTTTSNNFKEVLVKDLKPNHHQYRLKEEVAELVLSIKQHGLLQPITINQDNTIVAGHRRFYAHIELELTTIKANIITTTDKQLYTYALIENLQRQDPHPIELALSYDAALKNGMFSSAKDLAASIDKSESHITKTKNLLKLPDDIIKDIQIHKRKISVETISLLVQFDEKTLRELFPKYLGGELSRTDIAQLLRVHKKKPTKLKQSIKLSNQGIQVVFNISKLSAESKIDLELELKELLKRYEKI